MAVFDVPQHAPRRRDPRSFERIPMKYRPARYDGVPDEQTAALLRGLHTAGGVF